MSVRSKVWRFSLVNAEALSTETLAPSVAAVARARWLLAPLLSPGTTTRIKSEIHCQSSSEPGPAIVTIIVVLVIVVIQIAAKSDWWTSNRA